MLKTGEIKEMGETQMQEKLVSLKKELFNLRFQNDIGQLENTAKLSEVKKKELKGLVTSDKMDKSVVVQVERYIQHKMYKKYIKQYKRYQAHDEKNECRIGDEVQIIETRPLSKLKRFRVTQITKKAV
jgi:small subunit ribosomal protein S17